MRLKAIVLAAGEGTRMKSKLPKVLHKVCGQTMLKHVVDIANNSDVEECIVVVGYEAEKIKESLSSETKTVLQEKQLGTGHAVMMAYDNINKEDMILVLYGDAPLITEKTLEDMVDYHSKGNFKATVLTADLPNPEGYGRIIRDKENRLQKIVEEKDASEKEKSITEINSGIYCFDGRTLKDALPKLRNNNSQKEYYLTDVLPIIRDMGFKVGLYKVQDYEEIMAVNSREQLAEVEAIMRKRIAKKHMENGVTIINPAHTYIEKTVTIGMDTVIHAGVMLTGSTTIGEDCIIGQNSRIENSIIGNGAEIQSSTIINSNVGDGTTVGPYAHLRPNSDVGKHVKIGGFVEVKNSKVDDYSKASHLSYIGDADVGRNVNIGCGVVFVNYDGKNKSRSIIEDNTFIGSNVNLVAPVVVRENGYIACGSTITSEVPGGALAIARARQENKEGWVDKKGLLKE
ncbi:MAG TPA: bifunctional UDP-N-acetylglucosamine diphosphorylase/glucosamine-1-phosphate N-acetyltransferase GlmU [Clostridia bacterium]|nr:bifunctional UDP-N-acetylglucosamine diphosphorylase/glucosamine-1-phosphate N-acetyltransferase GlmU [Clostridia bacterium]